jgi:hypothetical protein
MMMNWTLINIGDANSGVLGSEGSPRALRSLSLRHRARSGPTGFAPGGARAVRTDIGRKEVRDDRPTARSLDSTRHATSDLDRLANALDGLGD